MDSKGTKASNTAVPLKLKGKFAACSKRSALSVINGDINVRKRNVNPVPVSPMLQDLEDTDQQFFWKTEIRLQLFEMKTDFKSHKQDNLIMNPYLPVLQKFEIFQDLTAKFNVQTLSPECVDVKTDFKSHKQDNLIMNPYLPVLQKFEIFQDLTAKSNVQTLSPECVDVKTDFKSHKQDNLIMNPYLPVLQKFEIFQDLTAKSNVQTLSPECVDMKTDFKSHKQDNLIMNPYLPVLQKFEIFQDLTAKSNVQTLSPECVDMKTDFKSHKQDNLIMNPYLPVLQKFEIFQDLTTKSNVQTLSPECVDMKTDFKSHKQDNLIMNPYLPVLQKFEIFQDLTAKSNVQTLENSNPVPSTNSCVLSPDCIDMKLACKSQKQAKVVIECDDHNIENLNPVQLANSCVSSPDCIDVSPEVLKVPLFSYSQKKKKLSSDLVWFTPYMEDIHSYLREVEKNFRPKPDYMEKQADITMKMRSILIDWFIEVGEEYKLQCETLHHAVAYVDRFLSQMAVQRGKLQLIGTASLFLASKYEEIYPPELKDFVFITDNTYTKKQLLRMEHLILKVLNFDISVPTAYAFQQIYCSMCNASETLNQLSQYFVEMALVYGDPFLKFLPSAIAAGSIALANYTLGFDMWDQKFESASLYILNDLMYVILSLYNKFNDLSACEHQAVLEKYKSTKYGCVATIKCPEKLIFPGKSCKLEPLLHI